MYNETGNAEERLCSNLDLCLEVRTGEGNVLKTGKDAKWAAGTDCWM
jgi:hypothetical protein